MLKIRSRVLAIALAPLVALVGFAGFSIAQSWSMIKAAEQLEVATTVAVGIGDVVHQMQIERGMSASYLSSNGANATQLTGQRAAVDEAIDALETLLGETGAAAHDPALAVIVDDFRSELEAVPSIRRDVETQAIPGPEAVRRYTAIVATGSEGVELIAHAGSSVDEQVGYALSTYAAIGAGKEYAGLERANGATVLNALRVSEEGALTVARLASSEQAALASVHTWILPRHTGLWDGFLNSPEHLNVEQMRTRISSSVGAPPPIASQVWFDAATQRINAMRAIQTTIANDSIELAAAARSRARSSLFLNAGLALLAAFGSVAVAVFVSRTITVPLAALTRDMNALAAGDKSIGASEAKRSDELGEMGRAVVVFKDAAIALDKSNADRERMEAEAAEQRARNEEARRREEEARAATA
ncbi:MAG: nitrate- and nitrite sensing domain-containing protein, partial [Maricaulaceae bacterium]